jgi:hypothetical protein
MYRIVKENYTIQAIVAAAATVTVATGVVAPLRRGDDSQSGIYSKCTVIEGCYVTYRFSGIMTGFTFTKTLTPFSLSGDWGRAAFIAAHPFAPIDISADMLLASGSLTFDMREQGPFNLIFTATNNSGTNVNDVLAQVLLSERSC